MDYEVCDFEKKEEYVRIEDSKRTVLAEILPEKEIESIEKGLMQRNNTYYERTETLSDKEIKKLTKNLPPFARLSLMRRIRGELPDITDDELNKMTKAYFKPITMQDTGKKYS